MRKLELKHIAPYLPYQLMVYDDDLGITRIIEIDDIGDGECLFLDNKGDSTNTSRGFDDIKPILRSLESISSRGIKELGEEVFGEQLKDAKYTMINTSFSSVNIDIDDFFRIQIQLTDTMVITANDSGDNVPVGLKVFEWFFKNHFDVFGLIEKGLAIDKNKL